MIDHVVAEVIEEGTTIIEEEDIEATMIEEDIPEGVNTKENIGIIRDQQHEITTDIENEVPAVKGKATEEITVTTVTITKDEITVSAITKIGTTAATRETTPEMGISGEESTATLQQTAIMRERRNSRQPRRETTLISTKMGLGMAAEKIVEVQVDEKGPEDPVEVANPARRMARGVPVEVTA